MTQKLELIYQMQEKKQQNNFTKDELDVIRKAEQNKKKRGY